MRRKGFFMTVAAWAALMATGAHAQSSAQGHRDDPPVCLTTEEAEAVFTPMIPGVVRGVRNICGPTLPRTSYLHTKGDQLAARFTAAAAEPNPAAGRGLAKMGGIEGLDMLAGLMVPAMTAMAEQMVAEQGKALKPADCARIDRALELLDPLPAGNVVALTVMLMEVGVKEDKNAPFTICAAE